jgi:predicted transcriptional regulator
MTKMSDKFKERKKLIEEYLIRELNTLGRVKLRKLSEILGWPVETIRPYIRKLINSGEIIENRRSYQLTEIGKRRASLLKWKKVKKESSIFKVYGKKKFLNLLALLPSRYNGNKVYIESDGKFLRIWYKSKNRGNSPNPFIVKKLLLLDDNFWINLGLFYGEGRKSLSGLSAITFTNTEQRLVNYVLNFLEKNFRIKRSKIKWYLTLDSKKPNKNGYAQKCINYWQKSCKLNPKNRGKIIWSEKNVTKYGAIQINYFNGCLRLIIQTILTKLSNYAKTSRKFALPFLKGVFAAEGSVILKNGSLDRLSIANKGKENLFLLSACLNTLGISNKIESTEVRIYNWNNFFKVLKSKLVEICPSKKRKFIAGFSRCRKTQKLSNLKYFIKPITSLEYVNLAGYSFRNTAIRSIKAFIDQGFLVRRKANNKYVYTITEKGLTLLTFLPKQEKKKFDQVKNLSKRQKDIVDILTKEKLSAKELSKKLEISISAVRNYLNELKRRDIIDVSQRLGNEKIWEKK